MADSYVILSCENEAGYERLIRLTKRFIKSEFTSKRIGEEKILLHFYDGGQGISVLKASFTALLVDNPALSKALVIPNPSPIFYPYLDYVRQNSITELFKIAKYLPQIYDEAYDIIASLDRDMIDTLRLYIESGCSPQLASYALFVHKNTVTYRISHFVKQTGISLELFSNQMFIYDLINSRNEDDFI